MEDDKLTSIPYGRIPKNYSLVKELIGNSRIINMLEGVILGSFVAWLICRIPFVTKLKVAITIISIIGFLILELKGVHTHSLLTALYLNISWRIKKNRYSFRKIEEKDSINAKSYIDIVTDKVKDYAKATRQRFNKDNQ